MVEKNIGEIYKKEIMYKLLDVMIIMNKIEKDDNFQIQIRHNMRDMRIDIKEIRKSIQNKIIISLDRKEMGKYYNTYRKQYKK